MTSNFNQALKCVSICALAALLLMFAGASLVQAQSATTGALTGVITDPSGGVIAGATVTATSLGTGQSRTTTTDSNGSYRFSLLQAGNYSVKISAAGFQSVEIPSVTVNVTETPVLSRSLAIGATTTSVTVESTAITVQTENATVGGLVSGQTVTELPLSTRNYTQVIDLSPGVTANVATATAVGNGTQDINVNGSGSDQNTYLMDGAVITNYGSGGAAQSGSYAGIGIPNPDSIQEFKVQTSQYDAAYGQNPGANVNVVTKSGTNQFHGAIWEFNRNNFFNANDFFYKRSEKGEGLSNSPPEVKQNQYGGTIGGPIIKDKLFFFGSYQGTRQLNGLGSNGFATGLTSVALLPFNEPGQPFANARGDNVGQVPLGLIPANVGVNECNYNTYKGYLGCAFAGQSGLGTGVKVQEPDQLTLSDANTNISNTFVNLLRQTENIQQVKGGFNNGYYIPSLLNYDANGIPACRIKELSQPVPTACSAGTTISQATEANEDQYLLNTDYVLNPKNTISEKYFFSKDPQTQSFSCLGGCYPGAPEDAQYGSQSAVVKLTSVLSNNLVNESFFSFQRLYLRVKDGVTVKSCEGDGPHPLDIIPAINNGNPNVGGAPGDGCVTSPQAGTNFEDPLVPVIGNFGAAVPFVGTDWGAFQVGGNFFSATKSIQNSFIGNEQISWNHGKHSFRAGFNAQRIQWNWAQPDRERGWINGLNAIDLMTSSAGQPGDPDRFNPMDPLYNDGTPNVVGGAIFLNLTNRLLPAGSVNPHNWRINEFSTFAQDDIKVNRKLTLNLGLRWEYDGWPTDKNGVFTNFAASAASLVNTGSYFLGNQVADCPAFPCVTTGNPIGTLAGWIAQSNFNKGLYNGLVGQNGSTGVTINSNKTLLHGSPLDNFSPRIGLAYQLKDHLVVRAGFGMFFDRVYGNLLGDNILGNQPPYATGIGNNPMETLHDPFTSQAFLGFIPRTLEVTAGDPASGAIGFNDLISQSGGTNLITSGDDPAMRTPKVTQYNLDVQDEFARGWILDVGYVGTHGIHLFDWNREPNMAYLVDCGAPSPTCNPPTDQVNQLLVHSFNSFPINDIANTNPATQVIYNTPGNTLGRVGYLGVAPSGLQQVETDGNHLYNSLQMQLRHNFSHGLTMQASYTWSKLITDINASVAGAGIATGGNVLSGSASANDPLNHAQQYGLAAFNRPQRFVLTYNYEFPFKGEGWKGKAVSGWAVSGVTTIQDGLPFTITEFNAPSLLYGSSYATGAYGRAEFTDPVGCNKQGVCKSGVNLHAPGNMVNLISNQDSIIQASAYTTLPTFGGIQNTAWVAGDGITGCNVGTTAEPLVPQFLQCGTGFGNSGTGQIACCTQLNFDMGIIKNTVVGGIREGATLQFRAEFYNLFNHAQFNPPANVVGGANFGQVTSSSVPGRILQFALKYSF
jgi:Carboxypeptidase regulatory-like domain/TonB dependent receptor/TonB-dependent Receptor Plug Domain